MKIMTLRIRPAVLITNCLICLSLSITAPLAFAKSANDFPVLDRIVAVVNQDAIPESELNRQMQLLLVRLRQSEMTLPPLTVLRKQLLDKLVLEKLQLQMAKENNIDVTEDALNEAMNDIASRDSLTVQQMQKFLEEQGITITQFRESIKNEMILSKLQQREVGQSITISKSEIEHFMKSPAGLDQSGLEYRLGHILISLPETPSPEKVAIAKKKAEELVKQLNGGGDFAQMAMAKSAGPQALNGGDLGFRKMQEMPTLFAKLAPTLNKGQVLGPIHNESGFHIIKLLDKRSADTLHDTQASKDNGRNKAMDTIFQRRFEEKLATWLRRIKDDAEIKINLNET